MSCNECRAGQWSFRTINNHNNRLLYFIPTSCRGGWSSCHMIEVDIKLMRHARISIGVCRCSYIKLPIFASTCVFPCCLYCLISPVRLSKGTAKFLSISISHINIVMRKWCYSVPSNNIMATNSPATSGISSHGDICPGVFQFQH